MKADLINLYFKERNQFVSSSKPLIIAHRGASGYEPENTLRSFKRAIDIGLSTHEIIAIELDVFTCKSTEQQKPKVVVLHDATIDRTTNGHGLITEIPWEQLKKYDAGKGEHIPLLSQVLDIIDPKILKYLIVNIELKDPLAVKPVAELIYHYVHKNKWSFNNFVVSSFNHKAIYEFHNYLPQVPTGAIFYQNKADLIKITQKALARYLILDYQSITQNLLKEAHSKGLNVWVYTVNDTVIAQELASWGVDGIITDYPDILNNLILEPVIYH